MAFIADRSRTMPPSLVERPLMPWPPLRTDSGTAWRRAKARASVTSPAVCTGRISRSPFGYTITTATYCVIATSNGINAGTGIVPAWRRATISPRIALSQTAI